MNKKDKAKSVAGVDLSKVNPDFLRASYLEVYESEPPANVADLLNDFQFPEPENLSIEEAITTLSTYYAIITPSEKMCTCTTCGGDSDIDLTACPYCGDSATNDETSPGSQEPEEEPEEEQEEEEKNLVSESVATPPKKRGRPKKSDSATKSERPVSESVATPPKKRGRPKKIQVDSDQAIPEKAIVKPIDDPRVKKFVRRPKPAKPGAVLAKTDDGSEVIAVESDSRSLDAIIKRINALKVKSAKGVWEIGAEISKIYKTRLWRLRVDTNGNVLYKAFAKFCTDELGMSYSQATQLIRISETYTKEDVEKLGVAKCNVLLCLPEETREKMIDGAETKTRAELSLEAKALRDGELPAPSKHSLNLIMPPGIIELPLLSCPRHGGKPVTPAMSVEEDPVATEILPNKIQVKYWVLRDLEGRLTLRIDRHRVRPADCFSDEVIDSKTVDLEDLDSEE